MPVAQAARAACQHRLCFGPLRSRLCLPPLVPVLANPPLAAPQLARVVALVVKTSLCGRAAAGCASRLRPGHDFVSMLIQLRCCSLSPAASACR